jgi:hypothetical protein
MTDELQRDDPSDFSQFRKPARKVDLAVVGSANESLGYSAPKPKSPASAPQRRPFQDRPQYAAQYQGESRHGSPVHRDLGRLRVVVRVDNGARDRRA